MTLKKDCEVFVCYVDYKNIDASSCTQGKN